MADSCAHFLLAVAVSARCIEEIGVGFMFAPKHHAAMKHAIGPRREMGVRTIFNVLGPLTNPAGAPNQVLGVFAEAWVEPLAHVLHQLGSKHVMVVHAEDGMDEISIGSRTRIAELRDGAVSVYDIEPEMFGLERRDISVLAVGSADESLRVIRAVLDGQRGPARDVVMLNAGAAIYVAGLAASLADGVERAGEVIASGEAQRKLEALVELTNSLKGA